MQPYQGKWSDLQIGSFLRDQTGIVWKVTKERDFHLLVENRDGVKKHLKPRDPNTPVTLMGATEAEAAKALQEKLGARVVAQRTNGQKTWRCPPFPRAGQPGAISDSSAHLFIAHGVWAKDVKTMDGDSGMTACHTWAHENPREPNYIPHTHG